MKYKINRAIVEDESVLYPIDLTLITNDEWVNFAYEVLDLSGRYDQVNFRKEMKLRVNFYPPRESEAKDSLTAQMQITCFLQNQDILSINYEFDADGMINQPKNSPISKAWRGVLLGNNEIRSKYALVSESQKAI